MHSIVFWVKREGFGEKSRKKAAKRPGAARRAGPFFSRWKQEGQLYQLRLVQISMGSYLLPQKASSDRPSHSWLKKLAVVLYMGQIQLPVWT